ncbi:MAG: N-6 DNA methylase, partial [candidate division Zixibacteria bacterium]|nr:N-6 DNA methylase [candidate division Zixibacteria bacterium]
GKSKTFKEGLFNWAVKQGIINFEDPAFYDTISHQIVYRVLGKILFYQTLRKFRADLPKLDLSGFGVEKANEKLQEFFELARQIDYQAVFEKDITDDVLFPSSAIDVLVKLINDLNRFNYSHMPPDVIGQVFEKLIPAEERHALGQYFTREELVDLINAFCVRSKDDKILDPTCGTGTFLIRAYDKMKISGQRDHKKLVSQLWGIDVAPFPAELATINLYRQNIEDYANFPKIVRSDFFEVKPEQIFKFPVPKPTGDIGQMVDEKLPEFDGAVGNFPYIRQELIEKRLPGYKKKIENVIFNDWKDDYRDLFDNGNVKISGQADIYTYLFFHTARFVKDGGRLGIVTSNAWLDVAYGYALQKFFLKNFKIIAIIESRCEPWFEDPSVNTIVTILERCKNKNERENHLVKFVKLKRKLKELIPWNMKLQATERWGCLEAIVYKIEQAGRQHIKFDKKKAFIDLKGIATEEDKNFRIRVIKQSKLLEQVEASGKTVKWGQHLRAPEVYFEILEKCHDRLAPLEEEIANIRRGYTTGINQFFYLTKEKIEHWGIEKEFLAPLFKSPKESESILIDPKDLSNHVFLCNLTKKELRRRGKKGALSYIKWGENQVTQERKGKGGGIRYPEVPTVKDRENWYSLPIYELGQIYWTKSYDNTFIQRFSKKPLFADQRVYQLIAKKGINPTLLAAVLNSSVFFLFIELIGRATLGEGALDTTVEEAQEYILCPNIKQFAKNKAEEIISSFTSLLKRPIKSIFEEVKMKDRQKLDKLVLEALGLDSKKYLKPIYDGLCALVEERIGLAKMRKNAKNSVYKKDVEKLKESILEEILPEGAKNFPEEFIDSVYFKDSKEISITGKPLKLGHFFMGLQEVIAEDGFKYEAKSLEEAKFVIYSQKLDSYIIKIPKNKIALSKVVHNYEKYLKELKGKFFETFFNRVRDHKQADSLTRQAFEELGLLEI